MILVNFQNSVDLVWLWCTEMSWIDDIHVCSCTPLLFKLYVRYNEETTE